MSDGEAASKFPCGDITVLLQRSSGGDQSATDEMLRMVYAELRKLAAAKMARESSGQTLQPTALVHEAWLRLGGDAQPDWKSRAQFFAAAAEAMRRILIENARRKHAVRHGGKLEKASCDLEGSEIAAPAPDEHLLLLSEALDLLAAHDARKAAIVKQWYFVGLTLPQLAGLLGVNERTVRRDLEYARAWLSVQIRRLHR